MGWREGGREWNGDGEGWRLGVDGVGCEIVGVGWRDEEGVSGGMGRGWMGMGGVGMGREYGWDGGWGGMEGWGVDGEGFGGEDGRDGRD